jgi:catechol 2,3-dioxygenase
MSTFSPKLSHMGMSCFDVEKMLVFYTGVFNFKVTDKGHGRTFPFLLAFLSASPSQHHQLVLSQNRAPGCPSTVMQLSFLVNTLSELREAKARAIAHGATNVRGLSHGNALSVYFSDPEDNTVEVYMDTPWYVAQPHGDPLDLDLPDEVIWAQTEKIVRADPTFMPAQEWSSQVFSN